MSNEAAGHLHLWKQLAEACGPYFGWVESPNGMVFYANFDDGYLYAQAVDYRYGGGTLRMAFEDATGWRAADPPREK